MSLAALPARADWSQINMPQGVSELSREIYGMHMIMLWICAILAVFTFGAMIFAMVRFRKSKGAVADQKLLHNARLEAAWTIVPVHDPDREWRSRRSRSSSRSRTPRAPA